MAIQQSQVVMNDLIIKKIPRLSYAQSCQNIEIDKLKSLALELKIRHQEIVSQAKKSFVKQESKAN